MAHLNSIRTDPEKETKGVWTDFAEGIRIKVARAGNPEYRKLLRELTGPHLDKIRDGSVDPDLNLEILKKVRAATILLGWENLEDDNGEISYSPERALEFFKDETLRDFYLFVIIQSENIDLFRKEIVAESVKN